MESHRRGELTELVVMAELKRRGIGVAKPVGDNERYDLVVEEPTGALLRVQIKTGWQHDGTVSFKGVSQHTNATGNTYKKYGEDEIDCFIVYAHEHEEIYLVRNDEIGSSMRLRIDEPNKDCSKVNWAENYRFDERWPLTEDSPARDSAVSAVVEQFDRLGAEVFTPEDPTSRRDLVVRDEDRTRFVRVERGWITDDRIQTNPTGNADYYAVWCEELDTTFLIYSTQVEKSFSIPIDGNGVSEELGKPLTLYQLEERWPPDSLEPSIGIDKRSVRTVVAELEGRGWELECDSDDDRTLRVHRENRSMRVRVKNGWYDNGRIHFDADGEDVDYYVVYHRTTGQLYLVSDDEFSEAITLRVDEPEKPHPSINWAEDYEFENCWPPE